MNRTTWLSGWTEGLVAGWLFGMFFGALAMFAFLKEHLDWLSLCQMF